MVENNAPLWKVEILEIGLSSLSEYYSHFNNKIIKINTSIKTWNNFGKNILFAVPRQHLKYFEKEQLVLQKTRMGKSRKRNYIFYAVNSKNALQISLKTQSKATVRDGAKTSQIQIPARTNCHYYPVAGRLHAICCTLFHFLFYLPAVDVF